MRTTVDLPEDLLAQAKQAGLTSRRTLTQVIEDALREALARRKRRALEAVTLPVFGGDGIQPGVDLDDTSMLLDVMDGRAADRR